MDYGINFTLVSLSLLKWHSSSLWSRCFCLYIKYDIIMKMTIQTKLFSVLSHCNISLKKNIYEKYYGENLGWLKHDVGPRSQPIFIIRPNKSGLIQCTRPVVNLSMLDGYLGQVYLYYLYVKYDVYCGYDPCIIRATNLTRS